MPIRLAVHSDLTLTKWHVNLITPDLLTDTKLMLNISIKLPRADKKVKHADMPITTMSYPHA